MCINEMEIGVRRARSSIAGDQRAVASLSAYSRGREAKMVEAESNSDFLSQCSPSVSEHVADSKYGPPSVDRTR